MKHFPSPEIASAYWQGYADGLDARDRPKARGWIFLASVAACLLLWTLTIATAVWLL